MQFLLSIHKSTLSFKATLVSSPQFYFIKVIPYPRCNQIWAFSNYRNIFYKLSINPSKSFEIHMSHFESFVDTYGPFEV